MPLSRCVPFTALALFAGACARTPPRGTGASGDGASALPDASTAMDATNATDATPGDAAAAPQYGRPGWDHPARRVSFPEGLSTSRERFLVANRITSDKPDAACWSTVPRPAFVACTCDRWFEVTTTTGTMNVLVCSRGMDPPASAEFLDMGSRSILYAAVGSTLKVLIDVPTHVTVNPENAEPGEIVGKVGLRPMPSPNGVTLVDEWENDDGPWCPQAVKRAAAQRGHDWPLVRRRFAAVCATAGRYVLKDGRLVKDAGMPTP